MKMPTKQQREVIKTVTIAVLVTAIFAFVSGMKYQTREHAQVQNAVAQAIAVKK